MYALKYSLAREHAGRHFLSGYNSARRTGPGAQEFKRSENESEPLLCAGFATVHRETDDYFDASVGSMLEGLSEGERRAMFLNVLFADTDVGRHHAWGQRWVDRLVDGAGGYGNVSEGRMEYLRGLERERLWGEKGVQ